MRELDKMRVSIEPSQGIFVAFAYRRDNRPPDFIFFKKMLKKGYSQISFIKKA